MRRNSILRKRSENIDEAQLERTFRTNIFGYFYMAKAALGHLKEGAAIINTTSVTAYRGSPQFLDYSATKGAIVAFTRSLAKALAEKGIRVNGVAPGPIWTPLIPSTFSADKVKSFGSHVPMKRPGQPNEVAPSFLFLACDDSSYITGSSCIRTAARRPKPEGPNFSKHLRLPSLTFPRAAVSPRGRQRAPQSRAVRRRDISSCVRPVCRAVYRLSSIHDRLPTCLLKMIDASIAFSISSRPL